MLMKLLASIAEAVASVLKFKTSAPEQARQDQAENNTARIEVAKAVKDHDTDAVNRATQEALQMIVIMFILFAGCLRTHVPPAPVYVQAEQKVIPLEQNQTFTAPYRGYYVPDAVYGALLDKIGELKAKVKTLETK